MRIADVQTLALNTTNFTKYKYKHSKLQNFAARVAKSNINKQSETKQNG